MRYVLENETLRVEIDSYGAEIKSIQRKSDGMEYMWQADPKYWGRTSPVLFPFVGVPKNKEYSYEGKTYSMGQHGFARDMEFTCESALPEENETGCVHIKDANNVWFALDSNDETYGKYPFRFRLHIGYELTGNQVKVSWRVKNIDGKPMYFSIGAHPAFRCPIHGEVDKYEYGLHFAGRTSHIHHHGNTPDGLAVMDDKILPLEDGKVVFTPGFFDECTYMVEGKQTGEVSLLDKEGQAYVTMNFDTPLFAVWSPEGKEAPFVCIEPWYGRCDAVDFEGSLAERAYENAIAAGGKFEASYEMRFF